MTERSSQLLGYHPEARVLIINADDFGMYPSINRAVVQSIENGIASSCSVMPPCPGAREAFRLLQERRHIRFGIHLTLICDITDLPWKPLAPSEKVSSLLDGSGHLFTPSAKSQLLAQARLNEIELELRMQIEAVLATGLRPTHLDWHALADGGRDDIFDLGLALAAEYQLAARVWLDRGRRAARARGLPVVDHDFLDSFALDLDGKVERYRRLLHNLPPGLSEWAVHPGPGDVMSQELDDGWQVRRTDLDFLISSAAREAVRREGILIIDYSTIRDVWLGQWAL